MGAASPSGTDSEPAIHRRTLTVDERRHEHLVLILAREFASPRRAALDRPPAIEGDRLGDAVDRHDRAVHRLADIGGSDFMEVVSVTGP